jgi:hypothetical protein
MTDERPSPLEGGFPAAESVAERLKPQAGISLAFVPVKP